MRRSIKLQFRKMLAYRWFLPLLIMVLGFSLFHPLVRAQKAPTKGGVAQLVWVDTDIGDDIDDAFALGLVVRSSELKLLGVSTAFGDTEARARIVDRYFAEIGVSGVPVTAGVHTETDNKMTQRDYADLVRSNLAKPHAHADGVAAMLDAIRAHPGQVTLIAIGPLFNIGAAIERDPETFHKLKRVVIMGGSVYRGYGDEKAAPAPEWNILQDPKGAQKLFTAGVPLYVMPLDSTQIHLDAAARDAVFAKSGKLGAQLKALYQLWAANNPVQSPTPTLFDPVAVTYSFRPDLCLAKPLHIDVDAKGMTIPGAGKANAQVCVKSDERGFLNLLSARLEATGGAR
jgi:inosine-uridine nucleoside N-ribohydrolase